MDLIEIATSTEEQRQFLPAAPIMHNGLLHCARCKDKPDKPSYRYQTRGQSGFALHQLYEDGLQDAVLSGTNRECLRP